MLDEKEMKRMMKEHMDKMTPEEKKEWLKDMSSGEL